MAVDQSNFFNVIDPDLPEEEQAARAKWQQHAEWGVGVSRLGGIEPEPELLRDLQRYIDGELSLTALIRVDHPQGPSGQVYQVVARR